MDLSDNFNNFSKNDLDICTATTIAGDDVAEINKKNLEIYQRLSVENPDAPFIISKFVVSPEILARANPNLKNINNENFSALRSVFMKHWNALDDFRYVRELVEEMNLR
jgi:hypothetical protein